MKLYTADKIKAADAYTIANEPIASINLMERAAEQMVLWFIRKVPKESHIMFFLGPGNNGGDGWALARLLIKKGYANINVYLLQIDKPLSHDSEANRRRLLKESQVLVNTLNNAMDFPAIKPRDIIVDGLFGTGLSRPLAGLASQLVIYLNKSVKARIISIDMPSGLFCEDNSTNIPEHIIQADITLSFQFPKLAFFFAENAAYVGEWRILPIEIHPDFIANEPSNFNYSKESDILSILRKRGKYTHKGTYGHALLIAGSYGMMGAAVLAARAALRGGAGLLTTHVPRLGTDILQSTVPESLLSIDESDILYTGVILSSKYTAIGVGPGINRKANTQKALLELLKESSVPLVLDADALNILSEIENWKEFVPRNTILTPHPKEFERLFGKTSHSLECLNVQLDFSVNRGVTVVLKGAHTCITTPEGKVWYNTTGNPGMATGGSGDVLTGLILGLLSQGYTHSEAAILGVYIHGFAGDMAAILKGYHGLIASDINDTIGAVFSVLEKNKLNLSIA